MRSGARNATLHPARGLTLVELLVALFILALLAQTAVLATEGLAEQAQQDATVRSLEAVANAVLGEPDRFDGLGRPVVTGFVADHGRLPLAGATDRRLAELWDGLPLSFTYDAPDGDPEIRVGCGWRGPYLRRGSVLGTAPTPLLDGWSRQFRCFGTDNGPTEVGPAEPAAIVRSLGADDQLLGTGSNADIELVLQRTSPSVLRWQGTVNLRIEGPSTPSIVARVYGPSGNRAITMQQIPIDDAAAAVAIPGSGSVVVSFVNVPIGPRLVRIYQASATADWSAPLHLSAVKSRAIPIVVLPGINSEVLVQLPGS